MKNITNIGSRARGGVKYVLFAGKIMQMCKELKKCLFYWFFSARFFAFFCKRTMQRRKKVVKNGTL